MESLPLGEDFLNPMEMFSFLGFPLTRPKSALLLDLCRVAPEHLKGAGLPPAHAVTQPEALPRITHTHDQRWHAGVFKKNSQLGGEGAD